MIDKNSFDIVLIGAGNLATNLGKALVGKGYHIAQVYSRTLGSAQLLGDQLNASFTTSLEEVRKDADLYIVSLKDAAFEELLPEITIGREKQLFVHTAGSISIDIWKDHLSRYGVFYPFQTFSKEREVDFASIPILLEANRQEDFELLKEIAEDLSDKVLAISSEQRRSLHLAAVFACNFTNHMYVLADKVLKENNLSFDLLLPLIEETCHKVHFLSPEKAQTGPAVRYDENVISKQIDSLSHHPDIQELYEKISKSIYKIAQQTD